jgi:hypothetical protein
VSAFEAEFLDCPRWVRSTRFNLAGARLADRHYSRRTVGSGQFMPPGRALVLLTTDGAAVWGSHWPRVEYALDGLDAWRCSIFRNEGPFLSSELIAEAMLATRNAWGAPPRDGWLTYVDRLKVNSEHPGYCFKMAGWSLDREYQNRRLIRLRATAA